MKPNASKPMTLPIPSFTTYDAALARIALEHDLESVIRDAAEGDLVSKQALRPAILAMASASLVDKRAVERVTTAVFRAIGHPFRSVGLPIVGKAPVWLANVVHEYATYDFRRTSRARWAEWDPTPEEDGP